VLVAPPAFAFTEPAPPESPVELEPPPPLPPALPVVLPPVNAPPVAAPPVLVAAAFPLAPPEFGDIELDPHPERISAYPSAAQGTLEK
jgi:hypothetical protein